MTEEEWSKKTCGECGKLKTESCMIKGNVCKYFVCNEWNSGRYGQHVRDKDKACDYFAGQTSGWVMLLVLLVGCALLFAFVLLMRYANSV